MYFWQPLGLTHALREMPEHSSAKALGKGASSALDTSAGDSTMQEGEFFRGFCSLNSGLFSLTCRIICPGQFLFHRSPHSCSCICGSIAENVTIIDVPLQDPVLPVLSFLSSDSAFLLFPLMAIDTHQRLYPKWKCFDKEQLAYPLLGDPR